MTRVLLLLALVVGVWAPEAQAETDGPLVLWHSYRGAEEAALKASVAAFIESADGTPVEVLAIPNEALASKLQSAIPRGNGPDVFIFAHERVGGWSASGHIRALNPEAIGGEDRFFAETLASLRAARPASDAVPDPAPELWGAPLNFKSTALFYRTDLIETPPATTDELLALGAELKARDIYPLAYMAQSFYFHAAWYFGYGGTLFEPDAQGQQGFAGQGAIASFDFVAELQRQAFVPEEVTGALVASLFNNKKAAMVINGPWFLGEIADGVPWAIAPLPTVSATGLPARPFLTIEAAFISGYESPPERVARSESLVRWLTSPAEAIRRGRDGRQLVATQDAWLDEGLNNDKVLAAFLAQRATTKPMDSRPEMRLVWEPGDLALRKLLRGDTDGAGASVAAARRHSAISRPQPAESSPLPFIILAAGLLLGLIALIFRGIVAVRRRGEGKLALMGWRWIAPAMVTTTILVVVPFVVGLVLAFFAHKDGDWTFVGLAHFGDILSAGDYDVFEPLSFYYALLITVLWTAVNVALHVAIGLFLAILLNRPLLRLKPVYRVLLILPWAVPNYITALIWKGMFHKQYGAINGMLEGLGLDGISWFSNTGTAFFANVCTNAWLGFPFMMVVCLGALQSIPKDLYQAAAVDGASGWQRFRHVTLPLLRPALVPAVLLGIVWTFNQFNIVYLVSAGEPDNSTDILISEAYRWAFARQDQFGYAAAYAALIFVLLLGWSVISVRAAKRAEEVL